jgi:predicted phage terminase large subunit-like protein
MLLDDAPSDRQILQAMLREDFSSFVQKVFYTVVPGEQFLPNWHILHIAWQLERVFRGEVKRLIILLPPRNLKSICASVAFPAWVLGHDPTAKIICVSYAEGLARKHALDCRSVVSDHWYKEAFPDTRIDPSKNTELEFMTTKRGYRLSTSVGGTLTGRGGNLIIVDDPLKPEEALSSSRRARVNQWYANTLSSRLNNKAEDAIIVVMQRLHVDDLAGHLLDQGGWIVVTIPAIAEEQSHHELGSKGVYVRNPGEVIDARREPSHILDEIKAQMGSQAFTSQYQQSPVPPGGAMIKEEWFSTFDLVPAYADGDRFVHSWDTASKQGELNDYSVGSVWQVRGNVFYLIDVIREKLAYPDLKRMIVEVAHRRCYAANTVLIEEAASGISLIQHLRSEGSVFPIAFKPKYDKIVRMNAQTARIEAGQVYLPKAAPWLGDFMTEVLQFPYGRHDDQVDSLSQFLEWQCDRRATFGSFKLKGW